MLRVAVLVSGGGTNLQALLDAIRDGTVTQTEIVGVLSNNPNAKALQRAKEAGVNHLSVSPKDYCSRAAFYKAYREVIDSFAADLLVMAGCMVILPKELTRQFRNRILNVHPSLIPAFCGTGYYGLRVHEQALARGVKVTGATVHFVDEGTDTGPILLQKAVDVLPDDTPQTLQRRVMEQAEWVLLPKAVDLIAHGRVRVEDGKAIVDGGDIWT